MLTMKLFGPFEACVEGEMRPALRARSGAELLALLTLYHDRDLRAAWVAETLWPDTGSLDSLRQSARAVREALGEEASRLEMSNQTVCLRLEGATVDLIAFDAALARGEQGDLDAWRIVVSLYKGPLLEGWTEGWAQRERDQRKEGYLDALKALARRAQKEGDPESAARSLRRLVCARPRLESAWCDLMSALMEMDERLEAIEVYCRYRDYLHRVSKGKLLPPAAMTQQYEQLHALPTSVAVAVAPPPELNPTFNGYEPVGGAVPLNSPCYIVRPADATQQEAIAQQHSIVLIKGPRQIGKSSLLARGLDQARQAGAQVFLTDLQKLSAAQLETIDTFFLSLAQMLADQREGIAAPKQVWDADRAASANFERFLRREVLKRLQTPVVWGLDEVDRLFHCDYKDDVFGLFRAWHNERSLNPDGPWSRLTLAMAYATEANLFISDLNQSPFNVGTRIILDDFTTEQVAELSQRCGCPLSEEGIAHLFALVGGHPYLVRRCLHAMQTQSLDMAAIEAQAERDDGLFGAHLERMLLALTQDEPLTGAVRGLLQGEEAPSTEDFYRLHSAGVVAGTSPQDARLRCKLYSVYLKRHLL